MNKTLILLYLLLFSTASYADLNLELPDLDLPDINDNSGAFGTSNSNIQTGLTTLRQLRRNNQAIENPEINLWIRSLGNTLTASAPRSSTPFYFIVAKDQTINAFATKGGVVVINAGLILQTRSESELAAVIAHEIAHITQRHLDRMQEKANNNRLALNAGLLAGVIAASKDPQAGQAIISANIATIMHQQLSFSREAEAEADRVGLRILARAGFEPKGMPSFLARLEQFNNKKNANILEYMQNHPLTLKRITDTQIRANKLGYKSRKKSAQYLYMREKIRALSINTNKNIPNSIPSHIQKYSKAVQLKQDGHYATALALTNKHSRNTSEVILISQLLNKLKRYSQTTSLLTPLIKIYPEDVSLSLPLVNALMESNQLEKAWELISDIEPSEQTSLNYFEMRQKVAQLTHRRLQAFQSVAEQKIRIGDYKSATALIRSAIKLSNSSSSLYKLQQQLKDIEWFIHNK